MEISVQTVNSKTFAVEPAHDLQSSLIHFDWHPAEIVARSLCLKTVKNGGVQAIELIKCRQGTFETISKEISERGYISAPPPYLLGLGIQYPKLFKEYERITSLDENNLLSREDDRPCFLGLTWRNMKALSLVESRTIFTTAWWFAVIKQDVTKQKPTEQKISSKELELTKSQKIGLQKIREGKNIFLTGVAGTGKTFLVNALEELTGKQVFLTASTGVASLQLVNGKTTSSFLGLGKYDEETATFKCPFVLDHSILVIDEISMIGITQWSYILKAIQKNCRNIDTVQIVICGDLWQMPPMFWDQQLFSIYSEKELTEMNELIELTARMFGLELSPMQNIEPNIPEVDFPVVELTEIVRQSDAEFISKLMDIRYNGFADHLPWLYHNCGNPDRMGITLVPTRTMMNQMNETIEKGPIQSRYDLTEIEDEDKPYESLELWKGMKIIVIHNNKRKGYVNGDTGKIVAFNRKDDTVLVQLDRNGQMVYVSEVMREYYRDVSGIEEAVKEKDYYNYMPLLPAYFLSVRRSQGSTIEYGNIHKSVLEASVSVQYTSLSRFKSIKNVYIERNIEADIPVSKKRALRKKK